MPSEKNNFGVVKYSTNYFGQWNKFVENSKNSTFLHFRNFMDYHSDRFVDHSLLIYEDSKLIAVFPANEKALVIQSHGGLTYGGIIIGKEVGASTMLIVWEEICTYYRSKGFSEIVYKAIPKIYHKYPSDEDLYALFRFGAFLIRRDIAFVIENEKRPKLSKGRKWLLARSKKHGIVVRENNDFRAFMQLEKNNLQKKYQTNPVHSDLEIRLLHDRFPDNIKLFESVNVSGDLLAGIVLFITDKVAHAQYIASTEEGKESGAFDLLFDYVWEKYKYLKYFDFGISTEKDGRYLNEGLAYYKESYGARGIVCDFYSQKL